MLKGINSNPNNKVPGYINGTDGTRLPVIDEFTVYKFISQQKRTAAGFDGLSHWLWKEFSDELTPVVTISFNLSIMSQTVLNLWKLAIISPIPKETPKIHYKRHIWYYVDSPAICQTTSTSGASLVNNMIYKKLFTYSRDIQVFA